MKNFKIAAGLAVVAAFSTGYLYAQSTYIKADKATQVKIASQTASVLLDNMKEAAGEEVKPPAGNSPMDDLTAAYMNSISNKSSLLAATSMAAGTSHYDRVQRTGRQSTSETDLAVIQIAQNQRIIELLEQIAKKK